MKKVFTILASTALLTAAALNVSADDMRIDEAVKLVESGKIQPFEELNKTALLAHSGGVIEDSELENKYGKYIYKVDVRDQEGQEWNVDIDASSGELLKDHRDD